MIELVERLTEWLLSIRRAYEAGRNDEALAEILKARALVAGALGSSIDRVDATTVVALLGAEKARLYGELARAEADVRLAMGDEAAARKRRASAPTISSDSRNRRSSVVARRSSLGERRTSPSARRTSVERRWTSPCGRRTPLGVQRTSFDFRCRPLARQWTSIDGMWTSFDFDVKSDTSEVSSKIDRGS